MSDDAVACTRCNRAVYARHVNDEGLCSFCRPAALEKAKRAEERAQAETERPTP